MNATQAASRIATRNHCRVVQSFGLSDRGQVEPSNEDRFLILDPPLHAHQTGLPLLEIPHGSPPGCVFLVADGMAGHPAGEVASSLAVEAVERFLLKFSKMLSRFRANEVPDPLKELEGAFIHANARIFEEAAKLPKCQGMGTTLTAALAALGKLFVAHAGHSRCYLFRRGKLRQLTQDHTMATDMVRMGIVSPKNAAHHMYRHVVTSVLGGSKPKLRVELHAHDLHTDDVVLLCSDGLSGVVSDTQIAAILRDEPEPRRACERLVVEANQQGGQKNITVIVAKVGPKGGEFYPHQE
jgi:serine/threonine protein phosphatase PrpC